MRLDAIDRVRLSNNAKIAQTLEYRWRSRFYQLLVAYEHRALEAFMKGEQIPEFDFLDILVDHSFDVQIEGMKSAASDQLPDEKPESPQKLAAPRKPKLPKSLRGLFDLWEKWRNKEYIPTRQKDLSDRIKKQYLNKLQSVWKKHAGEFLSGGTANLDKARAAIRRATEVTFSRAKMIVDTETTYYFNTSRREVYDKVDSVTHYLFLAIRDQATTKWCMTRTGLVYTKGSKFLNKETPPIHWNCRSEITPLVATNPTHAKLIADMGLRRENNTCEPLPKGWVKR